MKKKLLLGLIALGSVSMLCGFDSAETIDTISEKMNEASAAADSMSATMNLNLDASLNMNDGTTTSSLGIAANADFDMDYLLDPMTMKMSGTVSYSALGEGQEMSMEMYGVTDEDGTFTTYAYAEDPATGEGEWAAQKADGLNMNELLEKSRSSSVSLSELADWGMAFTLAPEAADVDGTECYLLSTTIDATSLSTILTKASELVGQDLMADENVGMALSLLEGLKLNLDYYISTADYLPVKIHMDLNDSDLSILSALLSSTLGEGSEDAAATSMEIVLNNCSIDMNTSYGNVAPITVPEEALNAEVIDEESLGELADSITDTVE